LHCGISEHFAQIGIRPAADLGRKFLRRRKSGTVTGNDLRPGDIGNRFRVEPGNHTAANDTEAEGHSCVGVGGRTGAMFRDYRRWSENGKVGGIHFRKGTCRLTVCEIAASE